MDEVFKLLGDIMEACASAPEPLTAPESDIPADTRLDLRKWFDKVWDEAAERYNELEDIADGEA